MTHHASDDSELDDITETVNNQVPYGREDSNLITNGGSPTSKCRSGFVVPVLVAVGLFLCMVAAVTAVLLLLLLPKTSGEPRVIYNTTTRNLNGVWHLWNGNKCK